MTRAYNRHEGSNRSGRPRAGDYCDPDTGELNEEGYTLVRRAAGLGLPRKSVARLLGMHPDTFCDRREKFPEIEEIYELGKSEADLQVSSALFKRAKGGDIASIRWYEMTRQGRSERVEQKTESVSYVVEAPAALAEEEWEKQFSPADDGISPTE